MKVLITGSSGYVGQHLIASLGFGGIVSNNDGNGDGASCKMDSQKYELFCAYNSLPTFENDLNELLEKSPLHPSITGIRTISNVDFSKPDYVGVIQRACGDTIDAIVHLAALSSPGFCEKNASVAWEVNCPTALLALNAPILYMSTDQIYEGTKQFYQEDNDETVPVNVYGRTKLAFERVLLRADNESGPLLTEKELGGGSMPDLKPATAAVAPNSVILRSSLILGTPTPFKNGCRKGAFPSFLQFIESRLKSSTSTDYFVNEFRSVVHVDDVMKAIKHFLLKALAENVPSATTRVFNLGGSTRASRYDIALEVANNLKLDSSSANAVNRPETGSGVPSPPDISMNVDKLTNELGIPKMDGLNDIVAMTFK